jgi:biotin-dependent carboxylase-like uncharacterized protein
MPVLSVVEAGAASVQGLGRYGAQRFGIAPGGAVDRLALAEANALTGQPAGAAAIEIGPLPMRFALAGGTIRCAMSGAGREVQINDRTVPMGTSFLLSNGEVLSIRGARDGQFSYLSFQGGLHGCAPASSRPEPGAPRRNVGSSWSFRRGDTVEIAPANPAGEESRLKLTGRSSAPIRVVLGPQLECFSKDAIHTFLATTWSVSAASNRMAFVLEGARVPQRKDNSIISDGTVTGNIQIAGSGQPFVILADRGTVGGYPKIATIISADIGRFSQTMQGERILFEPVSVLEAQTVARDFSFKLANVKPRVETVRGDAISIERLLECNVAGEAFDAMNGPLDTYISHVSRRPNL